MNQGIPIQETESKLAAAGKFRHKDQPELVDWYACGLWVPANLAGGASAEDRRA
jgi:hypothetical protein